MNWDQIKGNWNVVCDKIKLTWGKFSEDDLTEIAGQRSEFARMLQERYGYDQVAAVDAVDQFVDVMKVPTAAERARSKKHF